MSAIGDRRLPTAWHGALAGGGDPASSPLYVFGPFLALLAAEGTTAESYGPAIWLAVVTMLVVSLLYRLVMTWITDGSGGTGLSEDELGPWAAKSSAAITCIEYTLTFLVSISALVTFVVDRAGLHSRWLGIEPRLALAALTALTCGMLVNRGPRLVTLVFGPATAGVLTLLWIMMIATVAKRGLHLAPFTLAGFRGRALGATLGGFVRILAVMTGVEVFANLVAAYVGSALERSRLAFRSLMIIMGSTSLTMVIVGPAIVALTDPNDPEVSVFTQAMDALLPRPLAYAGTIVSVLVLLSAAAASAIGIQNLFAGLAMRRYAPAIFGRTNRVGVPVWPVRAEVGVVVVAFVALGTNEGTYLAVYAAGVFVLLSMTSWAATLRLVRRRSRHEFPIATFAAVVAAAGFTTTATIVIFVERFGDGVWIYFGFVPLIAGLFGIVRRLRGDPTALAERMGRLASGWSAGDVRLDADIGTVTDLHTEVHPVTGWSPGDRWRVSVPLDGSELAEHALRHAIALARDHELEVLLLHVADEVTEASAGTYLTRLADQIESSVESVTTFVTGGAVAQSIVSHAEEHGVTAVVMGAHGHTGWRAAVIGSVTRDVIATGRVTVLSVSAPPP
jgi:nucleotide-binding universal stress UspA family protein